MVLFDFQSLLVLRTEVDCSKVRCSVRPEPPKLISAMEVEYLVFKEIIRILPLEFIEDLWICEPFCFFKVSLDTYKSMQLKVIILSKTIILFLVFVVVTEQQFSFMSQGRENPFLSPLTWSTVTESGCDHGVTPSLCMSPSLTTH